LEGHAGGFLSSDIFGESLLEVWLEPSDKTLITINQNALEDIEENKIEKDHYSKNLTLSGPCGTIGECANSVSFNLLRDFPELFDFFGSSGLTKSPSLENIIHPGNTFSAWSALAARLVLVELHQSPDALDRVVVLIYCKTRYARIFVAHLLMTMRAAVPRPDGAAASASKSIMISSQICFK
jgi:hypothetical protein